MGPILLAGGMGSGRSAILMAALLAASIGHTNAPVYRKDEEKEPWEVRALREKAEKEQEVIRTHNKIKASNGLSKFIIGGVDIWALNAKNANKKYEKLRLQC